jgi:predicted transposase YdaD
MRDRIEGPGISGRFQLVDIRDLDGEGLLASGCIGDNVLAVLTRLGEQPKAVRRILERVAAGSPEERDQALAELLILAKLRRLSREVIRETRKMPILEDIMDHDVIGPAIRKGLRQGLQQGRVEGQMEILHRQIRKRFGRIPSAVGQRMAALKPAQLNRIAERLLDARSIEDLFAQ